MSFTPTENHQIKFSISFIHKISGIPKRKVFRSLNLVDEICTGKKKCVTKYGWLTNANISSSKQLKMKTNNFSQFNILDIFCILNHHVYRCSVLINGTKKITGEKRKFFDSPHDSLELIKRVSFSQRYLQSALLLYMQKSCYCFLFPLVS